MPIDPAKLKPLVLSELKPPMNITLVAPSHGLDELSSFIAKKLADPLGMVGLDTETNVVHDFYFRRARCIQVGDKAEQFVIDLREFAGSLEKLTETQGLYKLNEVYKPIFDILTPAICSNKVLKIGQNLGYEYEVLYFLFGQRIWHLYSTDLAERTIQAGAISLKKMAEFSMQAIVARRFGLLVDKTEQEGFWADAPLTQKQLEYAAFDVRMPFSMRESQIRQMSADQLLATAQIENDALGSFQDMHLNGVLVNGPRWMKRIDATMERRKEELQSLDVEFIQKVGHKSNQIDLKEMARRERVWKEGFETPTEEETKKAEEIRCTRDNAQKKVLREELDKLKKERAAKKAEARRSYSELSKANTDYKHKLEKCEGEAYINYGSNDQLLKALKMFKGMGTLESVGDDHLLRYNDRVMIQTLRKYRKGKKDTGTYGAQWTKQWITKACKEEGWCHPWDGRIHPKFNQYEAETGRSSCSQPNAQNLPAVTEVRECFICDPPDENIRISVCCEEEATQVTGDWVCPKCGRPCQTKAEEYCIVTVDMSGAELRIIAELANAQTWITAFDKGWDVHSVSTEILEPEKWKNGGLPDCAYFELDAEGNPKRQKCECPVHKKLRKHTKAINFLLCYGGGPDALADELDITVDAARELMQKHEKAFPDVWGYLRRSGELAQQKREARDLYGRRRLLPEPTWESSKEYFKDEHADRLELNEEAQDKNLFNFKAAYLRKPTEEEKYKLTHREPTDSETRSAMRGLWGSIARRGKNHAIQGSNASIIKRAMSCGFDVNGKPYLWHILPTLKAKLLSMIHDELLLQCPKRLGDKVARTVADAFRRAAAEVMSKVVMEADWHIGPHWIKD